MPATVLTPTSSRICFSLLFSLARLAWLGSQIKTTTIKHYKHLVHLREKPLHWVRPNRRTEQNSDSNPSQKPEPGLRLQICTMCHSCQWRVITIIITLFFYFLLLLLLHYSSFTATTTIDDAQRKTVPLPAVYCASVSLLIQAPPLGSNFRTSTRARLGITD